jgi:hypothetical protein
MSIAKTKWCPLFILLKNRVSFACSQNTKFRGLSEVVFANKRCYATYFISTILRKTTFNMNF